MTPQQNAPAVGAARGVADFQNRPGDFSTLPPIEKLLPRLDGVKKTGPQKWVARCPAHEDRRPSLSIRETDDGTLLLKCWSGCGGADVIEAAGLRLHDLFPRRAENRPALRPDQRWFPRDAMEAVAHEAMVVAVAGEMVAKGEGLNRDGLDRVALAAGRLRAAAREVGCHV